MSSDRVSECKSELLPNWPLPLNIRRKMVARRQASRERAHVAQLIPLSNYSNNNGIQREIIRNGARIIFSQFSLLALGFYHREIVILHRARRTSLHLPMFFISQVFSQVFPSPPMPPTIELQISK